jgi:hypothetical protein
MDCSKVADWEFVRELIRESYQLIAPKRSLAKLGEPNQKRTSKSTPTTKTRLAKKKGKTKT